MSDEHRKPSGDRSTGRKSAEKPGAKAEEEKLGYPSEQPKNEEAAHQKKESRQKPNTDPPNADRPVDEDPAG